MVEKLVKENPANMHMHYGNPNVGVLNPPDRLPSVTLYSYAQGEKQFNKIMHDVYQTEKKAKPKKKGFPLILKIAGALLFVGALIKGGLRVFKKP